MSRLTWTVECGQRFGRLTVTDPRARIYTRSRPTGERAAICQCDCGNETLVRIVNLARGHTSSCGCLLAEARIRNGRSPENIAHIAEQGRLVAQTAEHRARSAALRRTHGLSSHPLYETHRDMLSRCHDPRAKDYGRYGALGVVVAPEWHDVATFIAWIEANLGPRAAGMTLDRIDGSRGYEPGNVRWATPREQAQNRRLPVRKRRPS